MREAINKSNKKENSRYLKRVSDIERETDYCDNFKYE